MTELQIAAFAFPDRLSCEPDDPGFAAFNNLKAAGFEFDVYVDGEKQHACITADRIEKFAKVFVTPLRVDPSKNYCVSVVLHGVVEFRVKQ